MEAFIVFDYDPVKSKRKSKLKEKRSGVAKSRYIPLDFKKIDPPTK